MLSHSYKSLLKLLSNYKYFLPRVRVRIRVRVRVRLRAIAMVRVRVRVSVRVRVTTWLCNRSPIGCL